jgi:hypothetical protein
VQSQRLLAFTVLTVIVTLSSCFPAGRFLLYIDPHEFEVLGVQGVDRAAIRQSLPKDLNVKIEVSPTQIEGQEGVRRFLEVIERNRPTWVYVSAAHPFDPAAIIPRYPDIRFFREDQEGAGPANQITVVYNREPANYEAGMAIAKLLQDADFLKRIGVGEPGATEPRVGILTAVSTESVQRESTAFIEGFSQLEDPRRIVIKEIGNLTDRVKARRLLDGMREEAVAIVFLKTYVLSGFCLENLAKESGVAVVEGPISDRAYGDTVLLMLVDDFMGALEQMAESVEKVSHGKRAEPVTAPVELRWHQDYRSIVDGVLAEVNQQGVNQQ